MYGVCPAERRGRNFRKSKVLDLSGSGTGKGSGFPGHGQDHRLLDELSQRSNRVFNRNCAVRTMDIVEVDVIDSQPRQRLVDRFVDVLRVAPEPMIGASTAPGTELSSEKDFVSLSGLLEPVEYRQK